MSDTESTKQTASPYFRRDQQTGISPPDLTKDSNYVDHIVHARGKRTRFTSVSLDLSRLRDLGEASYRLIREEIDADGHYLVEHAELVGALRTIVGQERRGEKQKAIQALRYARLRKEGLVDWRAFDISRIHRNDVITWAADRIQKYFKRV